MKKIVYTAISNGIDGREKDDKLYASYDEAELDKLIVSDPSKNWRRKGEEIVDVEKARKKALAKLDGVDRLVLGLPTWLEEK